MSLIRSRWAAIGAAVAVTLGAGSIGLVSATNPVDAVAFVPISPCRVMDTRAGEFNVGPKSSPLGPDEVHTVTAHGNNGECTGIPATATAVSLNVTALDATLLTFLTVWAAGATQPNAASLNPSPGAPPVPNAVVTPLSVGGQFSIYNLQGSVNVIADINGYYTDHNHDDRYLSAGQAAEPPATQSRWVGCNGPAMTTPDDDDNTFALTNSNLGYIGATTNGTEFYCSLDLPQGAQMNGFRGLLRDIGPSGSGQGLARCFLQNMTLTGPDAGKELTISNTAFGTGTTGTNGAETPLFFEDPMPTVTVDNENAVYFIHCDVFGLGSTTANQLGIYMAQVRYNFAAVPGTNN